jgi:hypothetical protein
MFRHATHDAKHTAFWALVAALASAFLLACSGVATAMFVTAPAMRKHCVSVTDLEAASRMVGRGELSQRDYHVIYRRALSTTC